MHILKFTSGGESETIYCNETIGFGDSSTVSATYFTISETIGFSFFIPTELDETLYETIGFGDVTPYLIDVSDTIGFGDLPPVLAYFVSLDESIGFNDSGDESLEVYIEESIGFGDLVEQELSNSIVCTETIGFDISGYNEIYNPHDITFTWRTRTNSYPAYGFGASEYGSIVSYGDGNASNLSSFEVHIWRVGGPDSNRYLNSNPVGEFDERLIVQSITINDTDDPDADASYTLTAANNITLNGGTFLSDLEVEIFVKDSNGVYSFAKIIITDTLKVYHED